MPSWQALGDVRPERLNDARVQLHWAVQAVAAVGNTLIKALPDFSHHSLEWLAATGALAGQTARFTVPFRAGLRVGDFALVLLDDGGAEAAAMPLKGYSLPRAAAWLEGAIGELAGQTFTAHLERPHYSLPAHPAGQGGSLGAPKRKALAEWARWFGNADGMLRELAGREAGASPVRCWPHHFDIATLIALDVGGGETARSIGVGMAPGDAGIGEPYWYVTPWPYPKPAGLPALGGEGTWNTEGWVGAVLRGTQVVADRDAALQEARVRSFLGSAVAACRDLLGAR